MKNFVRARVNAAAPAVAAVALLCTAAVPAPPAAAADLIEGIAAIVDSDVILMSELAAAVQQRVDQIQSQHGALSREELVEIQEATLESLIEDQLVLLIAERHDMAATAAEITESIARIAADEGSSVEDIYATVARHGIDRESYREQIGRQLTRMRVLDGAVKSRVTVTDAEVEALYEKRYADSSPGERVRVLHLLMPFPPDVSSEDRNKMRVVARDIRERALESGDFPGLVRRYSAGPTARDGGLTEFREGDSAPEISAALAGLAPGTITEVIELGGAIHIFQFLERFEPGSIPLEEVREDLRRELVQHKTMPEFQAFLDKMRKQIYIEVMLGKERS